jgi:hypothetical protein
MFSLIRLPEERHLIDAGRVSCPLRGRDADVEDCLRCGFLRKLVPQGEAAFVGCRPPRKRFAVP